MTYDQNVCYGVWKVKISKRLYLLVINANNSYNQNPEFFALINYSVS